MLVTNYDDHVILCTSNGREQILPQRETRVARMGTVASSLDDKGEGGPLPLSSLLLSLTSETTTAPSLVNDVTRPSAATEKRKYSMHASIPNGDVSQQHIPLKIAKYTSMDDNELVACDSEDYKLAKFTPKVDNESIACDSKSYCTEVSNDCVIDNQPLNTNISAMIHNKDTLTEFRFKANQHVYAKDDATCLLYRAVVREVKIGPKVDAGDDVDAFHYLIHYHGWADRWDKWVLQKDVYEDSAFTISLAVLLTKEYQKVLPKKNQRMSLPQMATWMRLSVKLEAEHRMTESKVASGTESAEEVVVDEPALPITVANLQKQARLHIGRRGVGVVGGGKRKVLPKNSCATKIIETQYRPHPNLPIHLASGKQIPTKCFNPFDLAAPPGMWDQIGRDISKCISALLGYNSSMQQFHMLHLQDLNENINMDKVMEKEGYVGFCIHDGRDVLLCGLNKRAAAESFRAVAKARDATDVEDEAIEMISIIKMNAERESNTFAITDDYTTRFGLSTTQLGPLRGTTNPKTLKRMIARGGPAQVHFKKPPGGHGDDNLITSRAKSRIDMVCLAWKLSSDFRNWQKINRPRITINWQKTNTCVRAPFTLVASLPDESNKLQVRLAKWESRLRAIEEHLMISLFGSLPNIIWASILARVYENAETLMGDFDVPTYEAWSKSDDTKYSGNLGCPWKGCASRILPKGACGVSPSKPMHDDNNGVLSLGCWTSLTVSDAATDLVFLIKGFEVSLQASKMRWVLFMGYLPHETRPANSQQRPVLPRLHHSSFTKPDVEYLAAHFLSNLPCEANGGEWSMDFVNSKNGMQNDSQILPILRK